MNFSNILHQISKADPEVFEKTSERRDVIRRWGKGMALSMVPFAVGGLFKKAYGKTTDAITDVFQFALLLEYLEAEFYNTALASPGLIPTPAAMGAIQTIANHENAHVQFLTNALITAGVAPNPKPNFDYSGGSGTGTGPFTNVFVNYETFLAVAQTFEDTGVRAYKGQAENLMTNNEALTAALKIHSVEARHAAHIRQMRKAAMFGDVKPWITNSESGITNNAVKPSYRGENNTVQLGVNINGIADGVNINAATESFDEPLTKAEVTGIVSAFIIP